MQTRSNPNPNFARNANPNPKNSEPDPTLLETINMYLDFRCGKIQISSLATKVNKY